MPELVWDGKYDKAGRKVAPLKVALPFQTIETVNESAQDRQRSLDLFGAGQSPNWRNRLIWGDKKYVLPALVNELAGSVDLIYIDPPFFTGDDFTLQVQVGGDDFTKEPTVIEQKAYRDTWGRGLDGYLSWFYETVVQLHDLLAEDGSLYVHLDWHVGHYAKLVLDEVFGSQNFRNEIVWHYYNKLQGNVNRFATNHDTIFYYGKSRDREFHRLSEQREKPARQQRRAWDQATGTLKQARDADGNLEYYTVTERLVDDVWRLPYLMPADQTENLRYRTQKPEALVSRIIQVSSSPGDLVLDCFVGSGTTAAVAEKLGRRWIAADLGRFSIHTARKRLLSIEGVRPFVVQNLGKYERQLWQTAEFGDLAETRTQAYREFILALYKAKPVEGYVWLHGLRSGRMVHVGTVDSPVTVGDVRQIAAEFRRAIGTGASAPSTNGLDVLGWDFAFELNEVAKQEAARAKIDLRFVRIPREVLDQRAVEQGDVRFFELAALSVAVSQRGPEASIELVDFVIPVDDVPADVQSAIRHWSQWIDYWAVDWDNRADSFHNEWQTYRTRGDPELKRGASHRYESPGRYTLVVKVIDILGNDTTKSLQIEVP
jgi:DNA modification methylase